LPYVVNENCICCTYIETSRLREGSQRKSHQGAVTTRLRIPVKACSPLRPTTSMTVTKQKPNLTREIRSASFLVWVISGFYLLAMVWFLLSTTSKYGTHEPQSWPAPAVTAFTVAYAILMLWLWPNEAAATPRSPS
jgi:hypothetical protein